MRDVLPELNGKDYIDALNIDYDIRFCNIDEVDELIDFINKYWRENHIFVKSRILFDWQHLDKVNKRYNFVIAKERKSGEIHSILGFVPTYQFDNEIKRVEIWPCIWKSRDDVKVKGLGVSLYYYMKSNIPNLETISILGISTIALSIYKHWGFSTGTIKQYYLLNDSMPDYKLLSNATKESIEHISQNASINEIDKNEYIKICETNEIKFNIYKSINYYINRFFNHPIYKYKAYAVTKDTKTNFVIFARECSDGNNKCLRICDFAGDIKSVGCIYKQFQDLLNEKNYEYIDFVNVGNYESSIKIMGFRDMDDSNIVVPNYFEPFLLETIKLDYAYRTVVDDSSCEFVKADADQDRPNIV